jgi:hypothetical protein
LANQGSYYAVVTNSAGAVTTLVATVTVLPRDSDTNGLGDDWEMLYFGHLGVNPGADPDNDGMSNLQEYVAGTDPTNALSLLKLQVSKGGGGGGTFLRFLTMSNISYTLQFRTNLNQEPWLKLVDINPQPGTNTAQFLDPYAPDSRRRFYRVATPRTP